MPWELRGKRMVYYHSTRVGGVVVKLYGGHGLAGRAAERHVAEQRAKREEDARLARELKAGLASPVDLADQLNAQVAALVQSALKAAGFHCHRNCWRRYRDTVRH